MITQELVSALDDLLQAGAQASAKLRAALEALASSRSATGQEQGRLNVVAAAQQVLDAVRVGTRTEQTVPQMLSQVRSAVSKLSNVATAVGDSTLANALKMRVQGITTQMKAAGVGTPWLTILGLGAGAAALYYLWRHFSKTSLGSIERPDDEPQIGPRVRMMGMTKSLGAFRSAPPCRQLGRGKRLGRMGAAEKYEFEPEVRLEGHRGNRRFRSKK